MDTSTHGGKGSTQRPTNLKTFAANYDRIFADNKQGDRDLCESLVDDLLGPAEGDGYIEEDFIYQCGDCDTMLTEDMTYEIELEEVYNIGNRKEHVVGILTNCDVCGSDNLYEVESND